MAADALVLVEGVLNAVDQFGPVGVQAALPAGGEAAEEPLLSDVASAAGTAAAAADFVGAGSETVAALALARTRARLRQVQVAHQVPAERRAARLLQR